MRFEKGVDPGGIGLERAVHRRRQERYFRFGGTIETQHPHLPIDRQRIGSKDLGKPAGSVTPLQLHLEQPLLGMDKTEAESDVFVALRDDVRHAIGVPLDPDLGLRSGEHDAAIGLRQGRAKVQIETGAEDDQQKRKEACPDPDPAPPRKSPKGEGTGWGSH